jgi:hypothetical protein
MSAAQGGKRSRCGTHTRARGDGPTGRDLGSAQEEKTGREGGKNGPRTLGCGEKRPESRENKKSFSNFFSNSFFK